MLTVGYRILLGPTHLAGHLAGIWHLAPFVLCFKNQKNELTDKIQLTNHEQAPINGLTIINGRIYTLQLLNEKCFL